MSPAPPAGWTVELDPGTRVIEGGRVLVGGQPFRLLRLTEAGARLVDRLRQGAPVPDAQAARSLIGRLVDGSMVQPVPPSGGGPSLDDVAVVIPVRGPASGVERTLESLGPLLGRGEVVVVDDGSPEPSAIRVAVEARGGSVVRHERSLGPAAARNTGWRVTNRPLVLFVDADIEAELGWLDPLLALLADPAIAAVAPRVRSSAGDAPSWLAAYDAVRSSLDLGPHRALVRHRTRVSYVPTATLLVRRTALEEVDGFDEALRVGEDVDLVWRLVAAGAPVRYEPRAVVRHPARASVAAWLQQRFRYGTAAADLAARHGDAVAPLHVSGWSAATWGLVLIGRPYTALAVGTGTTIGLAPKLDALERPALEAARIAGLGHLHAARSVATAVRRTWWPLALLLAWRAPRSRRPLAAVAVLPGLLSWWEARPALDPARHAMLHLADDVAYGAGVWAGCGRRRSIRALLPAWAGRIPRPDVLD
ncbi:MAG: mycofactocin biosynthesis glycosyltransferase MftF [Actinomycetota bacterium]|nr:mycofactocin biosynthesis glycosyltransferase MftF [Actinomycetota bacterium]